MPFRTKTSKTWNTFSSKTNSYHVKNQQITSSNELAAFDKRIKTFRGHLALKCLNNYNFFGLKKYNIFMILRVYLNHVSFIIFAPSSWHVVAVMSAIVLLTARSVSWSPLIRSWVVEREYDQQTTIRIYIFIFYFTLHSNIYQNQNKTYQKWKGRKETLLNFECTE